MTTKKYQVENVMATKKYDVEKATFDKIKKLFAYRRITDLLKVTGLSRDKDFVADIINVQYQIYMLDGYLESKWDLNKKEISHFWDGIFIALEAMGYKDKQISSMVTEISDYEKIERNCRKDIWPTKVSMKDFYLTKSCDVRLIRHLIYRAHPDLDKMWKERAWEYYDIITEINDDITDLQEDTNSYNGNRFLISILRKGNDKTFTQYRDYLGDITSRANEYFTSKADRGKNKQLADWTVERSLQTLKLLETQIKSKDLDKLSDSLLLGQMK